jgi:hypothetical protein
MRKVSSPTCSRNCSLRDSGQDGNTCLFFYVYVQQLVLNNTCRIYNTKAQSRIVQSGHDPPYGVLSLVPARTGYLPSDLHPRRALGREKRTRKSGVDVWRAGRCSMTSGEVQLRLALPFSEPFLPSIRLLELLIFMYHRI